MLRFTLAAVAALFLLVPPAFADRVPTPRERAHIESVLLAEGFTHWEEIEFDDGTWEVDDAMGADGREYELRLDAATLAIVEVEPD